MIEEYPFDKNQQAIFIKLTPIMVGRWGKLLIILKLLILKLLILKLLKHAYPGTLLSIIIRKCIQCLSSNLNHIMLLDSRYYECEVSFTNNTNITFNVMVPFWIIFSSRQLILRRNPFSNFSIAIALLFFPFSWIINFNTCFHVYSQISLLFVY